MPSVEHTIDSPDDQHCLHWQEGDGDCCGCGKPNWCPDGGLDDAEYIPEGEI